MQDFQKQMNETAVQIAQLTNQMDNLGDRLEKAKENFERLEIAYQVQQQTLSEVTTSEKEKGVVSEGDQ